MTSKIPTTLLVPCDTCNQTGTRYDLWVTQECSFCEGDGFFEEIPCPYCEGEGCPRCHREGKLYNMTCPQCQGRGEQSYHPTCIDCEGSGRAPNPLFGESS